MSWTCFKKTFVDLFLDGVSLFFFFDGAKIIRIDRKVVKGLLLWKDDFFDLRKIGEVYILLWEEMR